MIENYEHYISRSIQSVYRRKLTAPFLYLILLAVLWLFLPLSDLLFPQNAVGYAGISENYEDGNSYIATGLTDLYFTGYIATRFGRTTGYYYYTMEGNTCMLVLLSPGTSEEGLPYIEKVHIQAKIQYRGDTYEDLAEHLAEDLNWTAEGLKENLSPYLLSEPGFRSIFSILLLILFFASGIYALISMILYILYICVPVLSPPCRQLGRFGRPAELLAQAEEELATLPQLATEDMFITEHYFIEIAASGIAIVPIQEIIWIYKYSTLHKIFWYHFNISYTLHITTNKRMHIQCPKNIKSDIDGIIDYLAEANHDILVGFNEENRLKVLKIQDPAVKFEKIIAFLKRRY